MLLLDLILYTLLGIYIDNIFPREIGMQRNICYVCDWLTPTYWDCCNFFRRGDKKTAVELREEYANNAFKNRKSFRVFNAIKNGTQQQEEKYDTAFETKDLPKN